MNKGLVREASGVGGGQCGLTAGLCPPKGAVDAGLGLGLGPRDAGRGLSALFELVGGALQDHV